MTSSSGPREIYLIEDDTPDYGLPPRRPSPSLLRDCDLPAAAFQPHQNDVPLLPEGKIKKMKMKKKDEGDQDDAEESMDDDEVMEIIEIPIEVKSEVKEEPPEVVVFSDNSNGVDGDAVQFLDINYAPVNSNNLKDSKEDLKWRRTVHRKKKQEIRERFLKKKKQSTDSTGEDNGSDIEVLENGREDPSPSAGSGIASTDNPCNPPDPSSNTSQTTGSASNDQPNQRNINMEYPERDPSLPVNIHLIVAGQQFLTVQIDPHNPSDDDFQMTPQPSTSTTTNLRTFRVSDFSQTGPSIRDDSPMSRPDDDDLDSDSPNANNSRGRTDRRRESSESRSSSPKNRRREDRHDRHRDQFNRRRHDRHSDIPRPRPPLFQTEQELIAIIKQCRECNKKFVTRDEAKSHYKKEHYQKHCPVCFALISCKGNAWKDHLLEFHSEDDAEMAKCPFCNADQSFEGMYNHIGKAHLVAIERQAAEEDLPLLLPRFPLERTLPTDTSPHILRTRPQQQKSSNSESPTQTSNQPASTATATTSSQPWPTNRRTTASNFHNLRSKAPATVTNEKETSSGHTSINQPNSPRQNTTFVNAGPSSGERNEGNRIPFKIPKLNRNNLTPVTPSTLTLRQISTSRNSQTPVKTGRIIAPHNEVFLKIAYTQKPTPGRSDYLRMAEQTGLEVGIIEKWFEKKQNEECRQKKGNKRKH